ncbi:substrate-binding domain-containing protein [Microbacterium halotolerans]|uniref:substrate-binding domain-containing protein n=1 Tax=Microbacterium halotolerans TaxID=246613 RepID=UPI001F08BECF|nr:substrate-binding domain-containing protein [Microbacterium halotolerans]
MLTLGGRDLSDDAIEALHRGGIRSVIMTDETARAGAHVFRMDHAAIGRLSVSHLATAGRQRIGLVTPRDPLLRAISDRRWAYELQTGTHSHIAQLDVDLSSSETERIAAWATTEGLDGISAFNDDYAMLTLAGLIDAGIHVPDDVAIIGADNQTQSSFSRPAITSIDITLPSPEDILSLLADSAVEQGESLHELPPPQIVRRATS